MTKMKKLLLGIGATACLLSSVVAQSALKGVYAVVPYGNNPFIFCTKGMPTDGWVAINPYLGTWTTISQYPNLYWVPTYQYICPRGAPIPK